VRPGESGLLSRSEFDKAASIAETRLGMSSLELHGAAYIAPFMPQGMQDWPLRSRWRWYQFSYAVLDRSIGMLSISACCVARRIRGAPVISPCSTTKGSVRWQLPTGRDRPRCCLSCSRKRTFANFSVRPTAAVPTTRFAGRPGRSDPRVSAQRVPYFTSSISVGRHSFVKNGSSGL